VVYWRNWNPPEQTAAITDNTIKNRDHNRASRQLSLTIQVEVTQVIKPWRVRRYSDGVKNTVTKNHMLRSLLHQLAATQ
jgi:hypothetical protein